VPAHHVYGITRRGYGTSGKPAPDCGNYSADRLGDDVLQVIEALHIKRPVLVGHSVAGEELSSIGTRFPEKVAGLIYLEVGYSYAYYDAHAAVGDPPVDMAVARQQMERLVSPISPRERKAVVKQLLETSLPRRESEFKAQQQHLETVPDNAPAPPDTPEVRFGFAVQRGVQEYTGVKCPVLAIFAVPHRREPRPGRSAAAQATAAADELLSNSPATHCAMAWQVSRSCFRVSTKHRLAAGLASTSAQANAFQAGNPSAQVIRLPIITYTARMRQMCCEKSTHSSPS
jgi:pimeloyl-ACP methyl ester carboxylesterase